MAVMERPLLYYATSLTGNPDDGLDVLQDVWIGAFRRIGELREPAALRAIAAPATRTGHREGPGAAFSRGFIDGRYWEDRGLLGRHGAIPHFLWKARSSLSISSVHSISRRPSYQRSICPPKNSDQSASWRS